MIPFITHHSVRVRESRYFFFSGLPDREENVEITLVFFYSCKHAKSFKVFTWMFDSLSLVSVLSIAVEGILSLFMIIYCIWGAFYDSIPEQITYSALNAWYFVM
jgi:hypothetical protein